MVASHDVKRLAAAAERAGLEPLQGHGIWIGVTLLYADLVGHGAVGQYLRKHLQILTPHIQANPGAHETFSQFIIPAQCGVRSPSYNGVADKQWLL